VSKSKLGGHKILNTPQDNRGSNPVGVNAPCKVRPGPSSWYLSSYRYILNRDVASFVQSSSNMES
jgi:hypothetical protein